MTVIENEQLIYIDCDDTLVMWGSDNEDHQYVNIVDPYDGKNVRLRAHVGHIKVLKDRKARGAYITVWSASGYKWAKAIVEALCLQDYVDVVSSKPFMYIDDLQANDILGERLYLGKDSKYGTTNLKETK